MPSCCIIQCGARHSKNQPNLTMHRFPGNKILRKKWIEAIGFENINPRHKMWHVCSRHFDEPCFNRTLEVTRLHDDAVPTSTMLPRQICPLQQPTSGKMIPNKISKAVLCEKQNESDSTCPLNLELPEENFTENVPSLEIQQANDKIRYLTKKCDLLKQKVRRLNEKVRRRDGKIALFSNIIQDLKEGKFINNEESFILDECAGPEGFLKRQIAKSKGLPLEKKYSEELRNFFGKRIKHQPQAVAY